MKDRSEAYTEAYAARGTDWTQQWERFRRQVEQYKKSHPTKWEIDHLLGAFAGLKALSPPDVWKDMWARAGRAKAAKDESSTWWPLVEFVRIRDEHFRTWRKESGYWKSLHERRKKNPTYRAQQAAAKQRYASKKKAAKAGAKAVTP